MAVIHLVEVDLVTGRLHGEWCNDAAKIRPPVAPAGREYLDVTALRAEVGQLSLTHRFAGGRLVEKPVRPAVIDLRSFIRLFTRDEVLAIAAQRAVDPDIEFFWMLLTLGQTVDLGHPETVAGMKMLVAKRLLVEDRRAAILAHSAPTS